MEYSEQAILKTLLYSDIFHFPLTKDELWRFLLSRKKIGREAFEAAVIAVKEKKHVVHHDGFYSLVGSEASIPQRKKYLVEGEEKLRLAKKAAYYLSFIPTVFCIGLSGGLAMGNVSKHDDIDFFIITKKKTLFMTRLWILMVLEWLHLRRKRNDKTAANKICVNLLVDEMRLAWPSNKRDLYTAHEIVQMRPLFERRATYAKFLAANTWVEKYLPNSKEKLPTLIGKHWQTEYYSLRFLSVLISLRPFERLVQKLQQRYMKNHQTTETVSKTMLAFHPKDYRPKTIQLFRTKADKLGLLTNI